MDLSELGQEYSGIVLRQETGMNVFGERVKAYQEGDRERLAEIEEIFRANKDFSLLQYLENWYELQKDALKEKK